MSKRGTNRVGVFSGTFDPVHRGHIEACIVALGALELDTVLILLEKQPRRKTGVADWSHRANMLELATTKFPSLRAVDIGTDNITAENTIQYLAEQFPAAEYWYIAGSDMLAHIEDWPGSEQLFQAMNICVVLRDNQDLKKTEKHTKQLEEKYPDTKFKILPSVWSPISSSQAKQSLREKQEASGLDPAVQDYIKRHELYA